MMGGKIKLGRLEVRRIKWEAYPGKGMDSIVVKTLENALLDLPFGLRTKIGKIVISREEVSDE